MKNVTYFLIFAIGSTLFGMEKQLSEEQLQDRYDDIWKLHWAPRTIIHEMIGSANDGKYQKFYEEFPSQFDQLDEKEQEEIYKKLQDVSKANLANAILLSFKNIVSLKLLENKSKNKKPGKSRCVML